MKTLYQILVLVVVSALGFLCVPLIVNLMLWANLLDSETAPTGFLENLLSKATYVWLGSIIIGIISLFIEHKARIALVLCPLISPAIFAVIYILSQS